MIKVRAKIKLYKGESKRKTPFATGYRPLFEFIPGNRTSGQITLLDGKGSMPGEEGIVDISFLFREQLGEYFSAGKTVRFYEGQEPLGEAEILRLL